MQPRRVLLAEDDPELRGALREFLEHHGYEVLEFSDARGVCEYVEAAVALDLPRPRVHALLTDLRMPNMTGMDLLRYLEALGCELPTVVVTAFGDSETRERATDLGAAAVIDKPIDPDELVETLDSLIEPETSC